MGFKLIQAPEVEPVTVEDVKLFARINSGTTDEDELLAGLITSAREQCEAFTRKAFITQKWRMYLDAFPGFTDQKLGGNIVISPVAIGATSYMAGIRWALVPPMPPVQSIDAVCYLSANNQTVTMIPNIDYIADITSQPARITPTFGKFWPISLIVPNAVWVDWTAGYGDDADAVPASIKTAIKMLVAYWYENREMAQQVTLKEIPMGVERLLYPFRDLRM